MPPATGVQILDGESELNKDAKSLKAYWVREGFYMPFIKNHALGKAWKGYCAKYKKESLGKPSFEELEEFFKAYDKSYWVVLEITYAGSAFPITVWLVLNTYIDLDE